MNILVTGSSGFVGSHLLAYLKRQTNAQCIGLARNSAEDDETIVCDLSDQEQLSNIIQRLQPALIFHTAGSFSNDFETDLASNVTCTKNLLDAVRTQSPASRVMLMGSAAEYGKIKNSENPVPENHPLNPISIYGWSKTAQTQLAHVYVKNYGIDIVIARTFNLIGNGMSEKLFVGRVEKQITEVLAGKATTISVGNLDAERDYIEITKACELYYQIASKGKSGEIYNVGSGKATRMRELLGQLLEQAGLDFSVVEENAHNRITPHTEVSVIYADIEKLNQLINKTASN